MKIETIKELRKKRVRAKVHEKTKSAHKVCCLQ